MKLEIFDVEHGACSLLTTDNYARLMVDCGHNATTGWKPGSYLQQQGIANLEMLTITNYDEDHASGTLDLFDKINVHWLWRNKSVTGATIRNLKSEDGMGPGIERLIHEIEYSFTGGNARVQPTFQGLERWVYYNDYPKFDDENNLSMAIFLKCHGVGVMYTGDMEEKGFLPLLSDTSFRSALNNTRVYFASHHGRKSGCSAEIAKHLTNVNYVIISDKGYMYDTQECLPFYRTIAKGGPFRGEQRRILTTRRDGTINFNFSEGSWGPY